MLFVAAVAAVTAAVAASVSADFADAHVAASVTAAAVVVTAAVLFEPWALSWVLAVFAWGVVTHTGPASPSLEPLLAAAGGRGSAGGQRLARRPVYRSKDEVRIE